MRRTPKKWRSLAARVGTPRPTDADELSNNRVGTGVPDGPDPDIGPKMAVIDGRPHGASPINAPHPVGNGLDRSLNRHRRRVRKPSPWLPLEIYCCVYARRML